MRKLLFFAFTIFYGLNLSAQPGWESFWSGYTEDSRGISRFGILNDPNQDVAWSVAYDGSGNGADISAVGVTTDGGVTWTTYDPVSLQGAANLGISMVFPVDVNTAYIAAYKRSGSFGNGGIWKTSDQGATWVRMNTGNMYSDNASFCNIIYFVDQNNGFSQGDPINGEFEMYYTTDGGGSWTQIPGSDIDDPLTGEYGYTGGIVGAGSTIWFTTNKGRLYRSLDQGHTWTAYDTPLDDFGGAGDNGNVTFKDDNEGWILRGNGELYHSTDGGETWTQMTPTGLNNFGGDIAYIPGTANTLVASEADSTLPDFGTAISTDGGVTWTRITKYKLSTMTDFDDLTNILQDNQGNPIDDMQHTCVAFRDVNFGLSGQFSRQGDPNDPNDIGDFGVFKYYDNVAGVTDNVISDLMVYPNPASSIVNIATENNNINNISVFDITGKEVVSVKEVGLNNTSIDVSNLDKGIYLLKVTTENNAQKTLKLLVK